MSDGQPPRAARRNHPIVCGPARAGGGDVILDATCGATSSARRPRRPCRSSSGAGQSTNLGGASNVVSNLCALGGKPNWSALSEPTKPPASFATTQGAGRERSRPRRRPRAPTRSRPDHEQGSSSCAWTGGRRGAGRGVGAPHHRAVRQIAGRRRVVILSDYDKGVLAPKLCAAMIERARAAGKPVIIDPRGSTTGSIAART